MTDLIHKAELFNRLSTAQTLADAFAAIQDMPTVEQWIPTTERLPDENTEVLVSVVEVEGERFELIDVILNGEWLNCDKNEWIVEAWMPLPETYKEHDDD